MSETISYLLGLIMTVFKKLKILHENERKSSFLEKLICCGDVNLLSDYITFSLKNIKI